MRASNLTFVRYGLLTLAVVLFLLGSAASGCSKSNSGFDDIEISSVTEDFKEFKWPTSGLAAMLPAPESSYGEISTESSNSFYVYVGNTTMEQYDAYVEACREKGFTVDYEKSRTWFHADNEAAYHLSLNYNEEESYMTIDLDAPKSSSSSSQSAASSSSAADQSTRPAGAGDEPVDGIRPSFKEAVDSYEAFFDEYCAFMEKYSASPGSPGMLADYAKFMSQYSETMGKLDAIGEEEMSSQELQYYTDAMARINEKLASVAAV